MATTRGPIDSTADREIVATRVFDAPRALVFQMWTDPAHIAHWWGPNGFTITIHEMDVRPGGAWRFIMHGPDGVDYHNEIVYREIVAPKRLAYAHVSPAFQVTATFAEEGGRTTVSVRMLFATASERDAAVKQYGAIDGLNQTLNRLQERLAATTADQSGAREFTITRVFDAPRDLVFKAWTETDRLAAWWGPKGFTWVSATLDLRPGGMLHYCMRAPNGQEMWGKLVYREIRAPERIMLVNSFSDAQGNMIRAPFNRAWPLQVLTTVTFAEQGGKTTVTLRGRPIEATASEHRAFEAGHDSMQRGFGGTLDQLADYLAHA